MGGFLRREGEQVLVRGGFVWGSLSVNVRADTLETTPKYLLEGYERKCTLTSFILKRNKEKLEQKKTL